MQRQTNLLLLVNIGDIYKSKLWVQRGCVLLRRFEIRDDFDEKNKVEYKIEKYKIPYTIQNDLYIGKTLIMLNQKRENFL